MDIEIALPGSRTGEPALDLAGHLLCREESRTWAARADVDKLTVVAQCMRAASVNGPMVPAGLGPVLARLAGLIEPVASRRQRITDPLAVAVRFPALLLAEAAHVAGADDLCAGLTELAAATVTLTRRRDEPYTLEALILACR